MAASKSPKAERESVLVALSGRVASSVTAALLKAQGFKVTGIHFVYQPQTGQRFVSKCTTPVSESEIQALGKRIGIPVVFDDVTDLFEAEVVDYFVHEYLSGRKPNPCLRCNSLVRFRRLVEYAGRAGITHIATGHYAQLITDPTTGRVRLAKAVDVERDQSYFLYRIPQEVLSKVILPLGGITANMVTKLAVSLDLDYKQAANEKTICFAGQPGYAEFIENRVSQELRPKGDVLDKDLAAIGRHEGIFRYELGQTEGFTIQGAADAEEKKVYTITDIRGSLNKIIVSEPKDLRHKKLSARDMNWIRSVEGIRSIRAMAKLGPGLTEVPCTVTPFAQREVHVEFDDWVEKIQPGQAIVFYSDNEVIGGATIQAIMLDRQEERKQDENRRRAHREAKARDKQKSSKI